MAKTKNSVGIETFVQKWMEHVRSKSTIEALAAELQQKPASVYQRSRDVSQKLTEKGLTKLPPLPMGVRKERTFDVDKLAQLLGCSRTEQQA
jgi:hypothetical protein